MDQNGPVFFSPVQLMSLHHWSSLVSVLVKVKSGLKTRPDQTFKYYVLVETKLWESYFFWGMTPTTKTVQLVI